MEEKIVILGNGFDLRHFLPTSYNHLISVLSEIEKLSVDKANVSFSDLFGKAFKKKNEWFYQKINEYYQTENFLFDVKPIKSIQIRLKDNSWFQYFKSVDENKIETWIDFESEIGRILEIILNYFDCFNHNTFESNIFKGNFTKGRVFFIDYSNSEKYFNNRLQFKILFNFNLFNNIDNHRYYSVNENFILEIDDQIQYYKEKEFLNVIYNSLEEFIGIFNDYIVHIINIFYSNLREEKKENFVLKNKKVLFENVNQVFSFNYTSTYESFYKSDAAIDNEFLVEIGAKLKKRENYYQFIHGNAVSNWNDNSENYISNLNKMKMVLGVDDIHDSLKKHKLFQFTKYFQKLHKETDYLFLKDFKQLNGITSFDKYTFYFWGHSLDYSDRQYIREIFDLVDSSNGSKIKIFYHSISAKGDQLKNLLGIIGKEKIEKFMKFDILEFIESNSENLFKEL